MLKLRTGSGAETQVPYIVSSRSAEGTIALVAPVTSWQAYNDWGGYSLYDGPDGDVRSWAVSFDRPYHAKIGANDYRTAALPIVIRAERLGVPVSYFANVDIHARPGLLEGARGYVSMGHDEYWTTADARRSLAGPRRRHQSGVLRCEHDVLADPALPRPVRRPTGPSRLPQAMRTSTPCVRRRPAEATSRFRDAPAARPENDLIGMQYECYPVDTRLRRVPPDWWGFGGTGVERGDRIVGLVGPEADRVYPDRHTPRPLQILSHTTYNCRGVTTSSPVGLLHDTVGGGGDDGRDAAVGLRPGRRMRAPAWAREPASSWPR